jgi:endonuclease/exonuclease/phosphatase family metal-dependent hydrolase
VLALLIRSWMVLAATLTLALIVVFWWVPAFTTTAPGQQPWGLQVMTTNLQFGNGSAEAVTQAVRDHDVELLSVQELTRPALQRLQEQGLDQLLPFRYVRPGGVTPASGTGLWSKYPIRDKGHTEQSIFHNLVATVAAPSGPVSFFAMHPVAPSPTDGNRSNRVFASTREFMESRVGASIAAGDFNATRDNVPLRELESLGWVDSATAAGAGLEPTWPSDQAPLPPLVALDHVLTKDTPTATNVTVVHIPNTDHRAVIASL